MKRMEVWALSIAVIAMFVKDDLIAIVLFSVAASIFGVLAYRWLSGIFARTAK